MKALVAIALVVAMVALAAIAMHAHAAEPATLVRVEYSAPVLVCVYRTASGRLVKVPGSFEQPCPAVQFIP